LKGEGLVGLGEIWSDCGGWDGPIEEKEILAFLNNNRETDALSALG